MRDPKLSGKNPEEVQRSPALFALPRIFLSKSFRKQKEWVDAKEEVEL